ncbi:MAG: LLM class flavin-dependent oxidoreductase [Acidimicrobiia bacterium]|nr:LLM class flavin-dependent oxidoreductase [Acidimicrobiia bacterium]
MTTAAPLPLDERVGFGFMAIAPDVTGARHTAEFAETHGFDSVWTGDHMAFPVPILDPLLQLELIAAFNERITVGTAVYLLPLRHPTPVAKQVATLDRILGGRFVFGVGVGGVSAGVRRLRRSRPRARGAARRGDRGPEEALDRQDRLPRRALLPVSGGADAADAASGGGPPIWCGGRSEAALTRIGRLADGWISYVVTPERYRQGLETIARSAERHGRRPERLGTGHLLFAWIDDDYDRALDAATEHLSMRYAMDFRKAARRYAALGPPADVATRIAQFRDAGVRHFVLDMTGPFQEREAQLERFATEVKPLL